MEISLGRHPDDDPLKATYRQVEGLEEHPAWHDVLDTLSHIEEDLMDQAVSASEIGEIRELQGKIKMARLIKDLPELFKRQIEAEEL